MNPVAVAKAVTGADAKRALATMEAAIAVEVMAEVEAGADSKISS